MLKGCSPMQEFCHVTVEKPPKTSGEGRVKENKSNRANQSSQFITKLNISIMCKKRGCDCVNICEQDTQLDRPTLSHLCPSLKGSFFSWKMEEERGSSGGGQNITIMGRNFDVIDNLIISHELKGNINSSKGRTNVAVKLRVQDTYLDCGTLQYLEDPRFTGYRVESEIDTELEVKIQKENDNFNISKDDIDITLFHGENKQFNCSFENITRNQDLTTILCKIKSIKNANSIATSSKKVRIPTTPPLRYPGGSYSAGTVRMPVVLGFAGANGANLSHQVKLGNLELYVEQESVPSTWYFLIVLPVLLAIVIVGGFTHIFTEDMHNRDANDKSESLTALDALICNKSFLVTVIHTLEKQKNFSVKDRCLFASFLTIALQTKLVYLTSILEVLTRDLMEQCSNMQPKLMLRRTESVVEKLLTNWMSVCLSGFLRETVGEPFYLLVTTLNQKINKGPVDVITCKALYTLNEDWLLWQVPEFNTVALNVVFEKIPENESADVCRNIAVNVLDCDTIGQAKDKIFQAFLSKNGSPYGLQLNEIGLAYFALVAIHSVLEKLFRSIWSLPNSRAPFAIKYFFDFLDAQAENKKITDPDVVHIWKTNSLPLRFWVNILKNPQFVFDIKKTPHIDSCLSVIAQAFMDAFSLTEQQLGKKHENEFNEEVALTEIYKYIVKYFDENKNLLDSNTRKHHCHNCLKGQGRRQRSFATTN
ncbi:hypothetical protein A6R68_05955 [Neotoma lepida]|uniref:Plexin cytoplasmic RasGAP domain-containing protein n=1 Tax=Neotoma lepida TaxID=56216 RepID=A0A1A6GGW5_NEOLE|nr:hypothetical protein A6R68_05955 [Neotoma lepida]